MNDDSQEIQRRSFAFTGGHGLPILTFPEFREFNRPGYSNNLGGHPNKICKCLL